MRKKLLLASTMLLVLLATIVTFGGCKSNNHSTPIPVVQTTHYTNGVIFTSDDNLPTATDMIVKGEKIIYVGNRNDIDPELLSNCKTYDLKGKMITPGYTESHMHPVMAAFMCTDFVIVNETDTKEQILATVAKADKEHPDSENLLLQGYSMATLGTPPSGKDLDAIVSDRPVIIFDEGFHSAWANSKALELAGIDKNTPDPMPGFQYFVRDEEGNPTGFMFDILPWLQLVDKLNLMSEDVVVSGMTELLAQLHEFGFTALFDAGAVPNQDTQFSAITKLDSHNKLNIHYCGSYFTNPTLDKETIVSKVKYLNDTYTKKNLIVNTVKIIMDGTVEARTAATILPFTGSTECAPMYMEKEKLFDVVDLVLSSGYNIHIHAIGDKTVETVLDTYIKADQNSYDGLKTICHNQMYPADGVEKLAKIKNIFFQTTPSWLEKDEGYTVEAVGAERLKYMYPTGSVQKAGVPVTFGCDFPASPVKYLYPIAQIYFAKLRGEANDTLYDSQVQGITVEEAIKAYTINGARQLGIDNITGSLTPGKLADFVILDKNLLTIKTAEIMNCKVVETHFRGKLVYKR